MQWSAAHHSWHVSLGVRIRVIGCKQTFSNINLIGSSLVAMSLSSSLSMSSSSTLSSSPSPSPFWSVLFTSSWISARAFSNAWASFDFHVSNGLRINFTTRLTVYTKHWVWFLGPGKLPRESPMYLIIVSLFNALLTDMLRIYNGCQRWVGPSDNFLMLLPSLPHWNFAEQSQIWWQDSHQCVTQAIQQYQGPLPTVCQHIQSGLLLRCRTYGLAITNNQWQS